jgi:glucose/arabinose dehydrogenase/mono/diheme cytochrome c family protein
MKKTVSIALSGVLLLWVSFSSCNSGSATNHDSVSTDPAMVAKGRSLFENNCSSCHVLSDVSLNGIGPHLAGVTQENSIEWLKNFIKDPKKVIESGDTTAQKLFKRYKTMMPSFGQLGDEQIDQILAFLHTQKKKERVYVKEDTNDIKNPIPATIQTSDLVVGVEYITQIPASSDQMPKTRITKLDYQPGTGDLFIVDLRGKLYKIENGQPKVYMDLAALKPNIVFYPGIASGFGSFAFHPEFQKNGLLYTTHVEYPAVGNKADFMYADSIPVMMQWVLTEWKTDPKAFPFSGKGREIFRVNLPTSIHGIQEIAFRPNAKPGDEDYGLLYLGLGDGGSKEIGFPLVSPKPEKIWGSILRIDPLGHNGRNGQYGIPASNPFAKGDPKKVAPEVYAWGFRNPHRISWTKSGQLMAVNIGEHNIEALNMIKPGHYYGWPLREGTFEERFFNDNGKIYPLPTNDSSYHITYPVAQMDHDEATAISGGFEYKGTTIPQLMGKFVFGDIGTGKLFFVNVKDLKLGQQATIKKWNISLNGQPTTLAQLCKSDRVDMRFGMDSKGEIYILTKADGKVYKLVNTTKKA